MNSGAATSADVGHAQGCVTVTPWAMYSNMEKNSFPVCIHDDCQRSPTNVMSDPLCGFIGKNKVGARESCVKKPSKQETFETSSVVIHKYFFAYLRFRIFPTYIFRDN